MKALLKIGALAFGLSLGVVVGSRLSGQATALAVGVVLGVVAGLPMGALVLLIQQRGDRREQRVVHDRGYPPVVVVNPGLSPGVPASMRSETSYLPPAGDYLSQRQFKIIGEEEEWE